MVKHTFELYTIVILLIAGIYAFDLYNEASGTTGFVVLGNALECSDSDNNNINSRGITISPIYEVGYAHDKCENNDLIEYFCNEKGPDVRVIKCPNGCSAGACN